MTWAIIFSGDLWSLSSSASSPILAIARFSSISGLCSFSILGNASSSFLSNHINWHVLHKSRWIRRLSLLTVNSLSICTQQGHFLFDRVLTVIASSQSFLAVSSFKYCRSTAIFAAMPEHTSHFHSDPSATRVGLSDVLHLGQIMLKALSHAYNCISVLIITEFNRMINKFYPPRQAMAWYDNFCCRVLSFISMLHLPCEFASSIRKIRAVHQ